MKSTEKSKKNSNNLPPAQPAGFFGRNQELGQIENALIHKKIRCLTITGIGGQGKTDLAIEAGRRLYQAGKFQQVCFVNYAAFMGIDAVGWAIRALSQVLDKCLDDVTAVSDALRETSTLLILDNVETLQKIPFQNDNAGQVSSLHELLDVVQKWTESGVCRVLLTSRRADLNHPAYSSDDNNGIYQDLALSGLTKKDALAYFRRLWELPPAPQVEMPNQNNLLELFEQVAFQPLSIRMLALPLKNHSPAELMAHLKTLFPEMPNNPLEAVLNLSLESFELEKQKAIWLVWLAKIFPIKTTKRVWLDAQTLRLLPRMGVFQSGAFEPDLLTITQISRKHWQLLRFALETMGLIQVEFLPNFRVPYYKFHPSLAPTLWTRFSPKEQDYEMMVYRRRYAVLSGTVFFEEGKNTIEVHALVLRDLPNLLYAIHNALDAKEKWSPKVANQLELFLNTLGFRRDGALLKEKGERLKKE